MTITVLWQGDNILGEGPLWDHKNQTLWWIDIEAQQLFALKDGEKQPKIWLLPSKPGSIGLAENGLVIALRKGFVLFNPENEKITPLAQPIADRNNLKFNDGKCDRFGRFYAGTADVGESQAIGSFYRLNVDGSATVLDSGFIISNGLGWSPDNQLFYLSDSGAQKVYRYRFNAEAGTIDHKEVFLEFGAGDGYPDGLCVDSQGYLWIAFWDGWRVARYSPEGKIDQVIEMPVPRPTSCCLGGKELKTLYITSARRDLSKEILNEANLSGSVFQIQITIQGLNDSAFKWNVIH